MVVDLESTNSGISSLYPRGEHAWMSPVGGRQPSDDEIATWLYYNKKDIAAAVPGRRPTRSERELWENYVASGHLPPTEKKYAPKKKLSSPQRQAEQHAATPAKIDVFEIGSKVPPRTGVTLPAEGNLVVQLPNYQLDGKIRKRLMSGKIEPESKLDLHGMNREEAKRAVAGFVLSSFRVRRRLILIVTGKGREKNDTEPIPQRTGILRRSLQTWLDCQPLNEVVQYVSFAHALHGGSGAFYVYLRRQKKSIERSVPNFEM